MGTDEACGTVPTGEARMRIEGGLAHFPGLARQRTVLFSEIDTPDRQELASLADQTDFFGCTSSMPSACADGRTYIVGLTIDDQSRDIRVAEPIHDPAMARLVSIVRRLSKQTSERVS